jgi:hypothetical protein
LTYDPSITFDYFNQDMSLVSGTPPLSRSYPSLSSLSYDGNPSGSYFQYKIQTVQSYVQFPSSPTASLEISQISYPNANYFYISPNSIVPNNANRIGVTQCQQILLSDPSFKAFINIQGVSLSCFYQFFFYFRCFYFWRSFLLYSGKSIQIMEETKRDYSTISFQSEDYGHYDSNNKNLKISKFKKQNQKAKHFKRRLIQQLLYMKLMNGGDGDDQFTIPQLTFISGMASLDGKGGVNAMLVNVIAQPNEQVQVTIGQNIVIQKSITVGAQYSLNWQNIQRQRFYFNKCSKFIY